MYVQYRDLNDSQGMLYMDKKKNDALQNILFCRLSRRGRPKFWNILISPPSPAVTTTRPHAVEDGALVLLLLPPLCHLADGKEEEAKVFSAEMEDKAPDISQLEVEKDDELPPLKGPE